MRSRLLPYAHAGLLSRRGACRATKRGGNTYADLQLAPDVADLGCLRVMADPAFLPSLTQVFLDASGTAASVGAVAVRPVPQT